jgi:hypothetical protein
MRCEVLDDRPADALAAASDNGNFLWCTHRL